ncbi:hypothetical protein STEG23_017946, partial [Scotinomys teguina]
MPDVKTERNTASQFCGTRFPGSPEDTQILAEMPPSTYRVPGFLHQMSLSAQYVVQSPWRADNVTVPCFR